MFVNVNYIRINVNGMQNFNNFIVIFFDTYLVCFNEVFILQKNKHGMFIDMMSYVI